MYPFLPRRLPERPPNLVADRRVATAQLQRPWQIGDTHASERHWITARCLRSGSPTFPIRLRSLLANVVLCGGPARTFELARRRWPVRSSNRLDCSSASLKAGADCSPQLFGARIRCDQYAAFGQRLKAFGVAFGTAVARRLDTERLGSALYAQAARSGLECSF